ncbi:MAG: MBG domain-containing protein [Acidobacteriota bacterium]
MQTFFRFRSAPRLATTVALALLSSAIPICGHAQTATGVVVPQPLRVQAKPLALRAISFPDAFVGTPFRIGLQADGGSGNSQLSIQGPLPDGLTANGGAQLLGIGGTPSTPGVFDVVVTATDVNGASVTHSYSLNVVRPSPLNNPPSPLVVSTSEVVHIHDGDLAFMPLKVSVPEAPHLTDTISVVAALGISPATIPNGTYNTVYTFTTFSAVGNTGTVTYTETGAAPAGMTWATSGGKPVLYGTPTVTGSFPFTIKAQDTAHTSIQPYAFAINPATQNVSFGALPTPTYGNGPFSLTATATSGLTVSITPLSGPTTGSNPYTITGAGLATFLGSQAGNSNYSAATSVQANVTISPATLNVTATSYSRVYDQPNPALHYTFGAFAYSDNASVISGAPFINTIAAPISTVSNSPYAISASTGTLSAANYIFSLHNGALTVTQAPQTIIFYPLPILAQNAVFSLSARATSGLAVTYTVSGPASITNNVLTVTGSGLVSVIANQSGNANYSSAPTVTRSFTAP